MSLTAAVHVRALAVQCPSRATQCRDWQEVPGRGWMQDVVCPEYRSATITERVRNLTENKLVLAAGYIDCYDWSNTGNPSQITGRVVDPGETANYRLEVASNSRYDLGFFVRDGSGLRRVGTMSARRTGNGNVTHWAADNSVEVRSTNTGQGIPRNVACERQLIGEDPKRSKSTESFDPYERNSTWIYSDGTRLYGVRCQTQFEPVI